MAWGVAGSMEVPRAEPLKKEELAGQPVGPCCAPAQRTSCLSFLRKHPAPGWEGGEGGETNRETAFQLCAGRVGWGEHG